MSAVQGTVQGRERAFFPEERKLRKERHGWCSAKGEHCPLTYWKTSSWAAFCVSRTSPPAAQSAAGGLHLPYGKCYGRMIFFRRARTLQSPLSRYHICSSFAQLFFSQRRKARTPPPSLPYPNRHFAKTAVGPGEVWDKGEGGGGGGEGGAGGIEGGAGGDEAGAGGGEGGQAGEGRTV